jgi:hypothetical protein
MISYSFRRSCPDDWTIINNSCYFLTRASRNFSFAEQYCRSLKAELVTIKTLEKLTIVKQILENNANSSWVISDLALKK